MTALAGLALLSSGSTPTRGPHAAAVRKAEEFLLRAKGPDGLFSTGADANLRGQPRSMYGHAFTMMFLAQVLGQEESLDRQAQIQTALRKAVDLTIKSQTDAGGWYYWPDDRWDEGTLTVTMMQGLRACRDAGVHVPKGIIERGVKYIEDSTNKTGALAGSVRYKRQGQSQVRYGVTCASVVALWSAGRYEDPLLKKIVDFIDRNIHAQWGSYGPHATYVQFYLAQSRFLLGSDRWARFYKEESALLANDQADDGSWTTEEDRWEHGVGAVYSTSIALIVLQLPYNRLPIFQR